MQSGAAYRGIVPFENSTNGTVVNTLDLFADRKKELQDVLVCGEAYVDVHHCLVGRLPQGAKPGLPPRTEAPNGGDHQGFEAIAPRIKKLYSHPHAWGQCEEFLHQYLPGTERQDVPSTSRAAEIVAAENPNPPATGTRDISAALVADTAAISSATAAEIYGLDILAHNIQDVSGNMTRFFILEKAESSSAASPKQAASANPSDPLVTGPIQTSSFGNPFTAPQFKTLISFVIPHTSPGALAKGLAVFGPYGLNLTSINTRPSLIEPWNYLFFVEILGKREKHGRGEVNSALRDLQCVARAWRWHGSWEMQSELGM